MVRSGLLEANGGSDRTTRRATVALIDDEQLTRVGLAQALPGSGLELVGEAATGEDGIELVVDLRPDVVLMDLQLPGISGVQAIEQLGCSRQLRVCWCSPAANRTASSKRSSRAPAATYSRARRSRRSSAPSKPRPPENPCCPRRSPGSSCSTYANWTTPSRPAPSPRLPSALP